MPLNRRDVLSGLETLLGTVTGIVTVVRSYSEEGIDITQYSEADLPLIDIVEPEESNENEMTSRRSIQFLDTVLKVWFVDWHDDVQATYATHVKNIRDKLGAGFTISQTATACWVTDLSKVKGEVPVWFIEISLRIKYYLDQQHT